MAKVGVCTVGPLMHVRCMLECGRLLDSFDASSRRAVVRVLSKRPHTAM